MWGFERSNGDRAGRAAAVGLIAGSGDFPILVARSASKRQGPLVVAGIELEDARELKGLASSYRGFKLGDAEKLLAFFKEEGVAATYMAGGIPKKKTYSTDFKPDGLAQKVLSGLAQKGDDEILKMVTRVLKLRGIEVLDPAAVLDEELAPRGVLTRRAPTGEEAKDIEFGRKIAKAVGLLDVGQAVAVKGASVLAVEAIEGTDAMIRRLADLGIAGAVVVKVSKPQQDLRFDMPVAGPATIDEMRASGAAVLAVEARRSLMLHRAESVRRADEAGIAVVGI